MTPEHWRVVDQVLQGALVCTRDHRDEFIALSCGDDTALRNEVSSLLVAYDATPAEFLERPAAEEHGVSSTNAPPTTPARAAVPSQPKRMVAAQFVVYAVAAGILLGTVTGWNLAHSGTVERWRGTLGVILQQALAKPTAKPTPSASAALRADMAGTDGELSLVVLDRGGSVVREIAATRPWTPRFSPDGRRVAYGAFGEGRSTSDVWITDVDGGATMRLTNDDADNNDPQWSPDGRTIAYSVKVGGGKNVAEQSAAGGGARILATRPGTQWPTDWFHDGSALLITKEAEHHQYDILVQPADGADARPYVAAGAQETAGRISPHMHWVAYTSNESGRDEVYVDSYPRTGYRVLISQGGGVDPVWRGDGRELYYWRGDALMAVPIDGSQGGRPPILGAERVLFHSAYEHSVNSMYDVAPDGARIVVVRRR
jgi:hypothetical protein